MDSFVTSAATSIRPGPGVGLRLKSFSTTWGKWIGCFPTELRFRSRPNPRERTRVFEGDDLTSWRSTAQWLADTYSLPGPTVAVSTGAPQSLGCLRDSWRRSDPFWRIVCPG